MKRTKERIVSKLNQFLWPGPPQAVYEHHMSITRIKKLLKGKFIDTSKIGEANKIHYFSFLDKSANNFLYIFHIKLNRKTRASEFHFIDSNCKKHIVSLSSSQATINDLAKCIIL